MPATLAGLRLPHERVLLARTKLAYVHLRHLLTDAKRDRGARVFGYVAIWLPEHVVILYLQEGEVVNATATTDGVRYEPMAIAEAIARVPAEPELGEICFHEADDEQLASMFEAQCTEPLAWPEAMDPRDPKAIFSFLRATTFDGVVEVARDGGMHYLVLRDGSVVRAFLSDDGVGTIPQRVLRLFAPTKTSAALRVTHRPVPQPLPEQASPALVQAYRELTRQLVARLHDGGSDAAAELAESARTMLLERHAVLAHFGAPARGAAGGRDPVAEPADVTAAVAAWVREILFATSDFGGGTPEAVLADLTRERRHMLQSAGFFDLLPWTVTW